MSSASSACEPVTLGLVVTPRLHEDAARRLATELGELLRDRYPAVRWELSYVVERPVEPPARLPDIVDALRARLLEENWDLAVCITELPLRLGRRTLVRHASPSHGVALVSLPAVGAIKVVGRLRDAAVAAVGAILGEPSRQHQAHRYAAAISRAAGMIMSARAPLLIVPKRLRPQRIEDRLLECRIDQRLHVVHVEDLVRRAERLRPLAAAQADG